MPADHSAAAEVMNTPTGGRSPQVLQVDGIPSRELQDMEGIELHNQQSHADQMRLFLRPHPIPGVENFGIPPEPEGEVNPDVQVMPYGGHRRVSKMNCDIVPQRRTLSSCGDPLERGRRNIDLQGIIVVPDITPVLRAHQSGWSG